MDVLYLKSWCLFFNNYRYNHAVQKAQQERQSSMREKKNVSPNPFHNKTKPFKPCTETKSPISNAILAVKKVRRSPISASGVSHNKETPMGVCFE